MSKNKKKQRQKDRKSSYDATLENLELYKRLTSEAPESNIRYLFSMPVRPKKPKAFKVWFMKAVCHKDIMIEYQVKFDTYVEDMKQYRKQKKNESDKKYELQKLREKVAKYGNI